MKDERGGAPVFVKVDEYKEILDVLEMIKGKIRDIRQTLAEVNALRNEEDSELDAWNNTIDELERKVHSMDKIMFEPEQAW